MAFVRAFPVLSILLLSAGALPAQPVSTMGPNGRGGGFDCTVDGPTALFSSPSGQDTLLVCQGELLPFDATDSEAQGDALIVEYAWAFQDGGPWVTGSGAQTSYSYASSGAYAVLLVVTDSNGCSDTTDTPIVVHVSATPSFAGTTTTTICEGDSLILSGTSSFMPPPFSSDGGPIPDLQGTPVSWNIEISSALPGQTLADVADMTAVCVNMEHTFMGDLMITLACPNGQSVVLHQQNGGGTNLGSPGTAECWNYCWSPLATNGTWAQNGTGGTLPAGTYESLNSMTGLVGCPVNGTWSITFVDLWAVDDGFLCDWSLDFFPGLFVPEDGTSQVIVSTNWTGPGVLSTTANPATAVPGSSGEHSYTFSVSDNFGCSYDTTLTVQVQPAFEVFALLSDTSISASVEGDTYRWYDCATMLSPLFGAGSRDFIPPYDGSWAVQVTIGACTILSDCVQFIGTGMADVSTDPAISVFPNPGLDLFSVEFAYRNLRFSVLDLSGRIVLDLGPRPSRFVMDLSSLPAGTYLLQWTGDGLAGRLPLVVQR